MQNVLKIRCWGKINFTWICEKVLNFAVSSLKCLFIDYHPSFRRRVVVFLPVIIGGQVLQRLSVTRALQRFFSISKTTFWWTLIKCIHDNNGERSYRNHYFNVNSQNIRVALSSLLDSSINRNWEAILIKSLEAPFRSSRSRAMFWSCKFTNSAQPQQHET